MSTNSNETQQQPQVILPTKVEAWLRELNNNNNNNDQTSSSSSSSKTTTTTTKHRSTIVDIASALDLTVSPCAKRASFPYSILPPLRHVTFDTLLKDVLRLPDVRVTALLSMLWGMFFARGMSWLHRHGASRLMKLVLGLVASIIALKWVSVRLPQRQLFSEPQNVSSNPAGVCQVTGPVVTISNSHAGSHADTPQHFHADNELYPGQDKFHPCCYVGDCVVLDVSPSLACRGGAGGGNINISSGSSSSSASSPLSRSAVLRERCEIDENVLVDAGMRAGIDWQNVWRLVVCTRRFEMNREVDEWKDHFAYFTKDAAQFLANKCPKLLLIGTDSPSVDRSDLAPIKDHAHGAFWKQRTAIVENIDCSPLYRQLATPKEEEEHIGMVNGSIQCVFNDAQKFHDAAGCNVIFYPYQKNQ